MTRCEVGLDIIERALRKGSITLLLAKIDRVTVLDFGQKLDGLWCSWRGRCRGGGHGEGGRGGDAVVKLHLRLVHRLRDRLEGRKVSASGR